MIIMGKSWKRAGVLVLGCIARASCVEVVSEERRINAQDLSSLEGAVGEGDGSSVRLIVDGCDLDSFSMALEGKTLSPSIKELRLNLTSKVPGSAPTGERRSVVLKCPTLDKLEVALPPSPAKEFENFHLASRPSFKFLAWLKLLFPDVSKLELDVAALPIHRGSLIRKEQLEDLKMEGVTKLTLKKYGAGVYQRLFFENLKLFPNVSALVVDCGTDVPKADQMRDQVFPSITSLTICDTALSAKDFLHGFPSIFPLLKELSINCEMFNEIVEKNLKSAPVRSFDALTRLEIRGNPDWRSQWAIDFGKKVAAVYPRLSELKFLGVSEIFGCALPPKGFFDGCASIKRLRMSFNIKKGKNKARWWNFLKALPELEDLEVEVFPYYSPCYEYVLEDWQKFTGRTFDAITEELLKVLANVGLSLKTGQDVPRISLFMPGSSEPIKTVRYPEENERHVGDDLENEPSKLSPAEVV